MPGGGAFAAEGGIAINFRQARELDSEEELAQSAGDGETPRKRKSSDRDDGSAGDAGGDKSHMTASAKKKANETWFDRDSVIAGALRSHQTWLRATKAEIQMGIASATQEFESITIVI